MLEEGSEKERLFSLIFIYSENVDRGHVLFNCNILFCIHIDFLATEQLTRAIGG